MSIEWATFLTSVPPGITEKVDDLSEGYKETWERMSSPSIYLDCPSEICDDIRIFDPQERAGNIASGWQDFYLNYQCRHCLRSKKTFSIRARRETLSCNGLALKIGEWPPFGSRIPTRVNKIIGDDRDLFFKGHRSENQGLGIGAYVYYRRVVHNQKDRLVDEIIKVAKRTNASPEVIKSLEKAKAQTEFSRAVETVKNAIPDVLKINGHNPLTLLHKALSKGVHELTDDECLEGAKNIRIVLSEFCERMGEALKEQAELDEAVKKLLNPTEKT